VRVSDAKPTADEPESPTTGAEPEPAWKRRARLAAVFGDVLPESTTDDRDPEAAGSSGTSEEWLKRQVPPHHG
jgi:hypothetical protein